MNKQGTARLTTGGKEYIASQPGRYIISSAIEISHVTELLVCRSIASCYYKLKLL